MGAFVDDEESVVYQVYSEFSEFLNAIFYFHININNKDNKRLCNLIVTALRVHTRSLCEFFSNNKSKDDNIYYYTILNKKWDDFSINLSDQMRQFLNKQTMHMSKRRGTMKLDNEEFGSLLMTIISCIERFMNENEKNIKEDDKTVSLNELIEYINIIIVKVKQLLETKKILSLILSDFGII